ncbi:S1C family serine protease [Clostridium sp. YIM B02551]|uniref:S1C family serine protease n=1 Tax=Clostridium sp. YIM B02551 TaxID=2910679 RepID=UPI001EEC0C51|nr:trypsin-like peptidase domain-containing protein [Clostridium sp. YIM B02551]
MSDFRDDNINENNSYEVNRENNSEIVNNDEIKNEENIESDVSSVSNSEVNNNEVEAIDNSGVKNSAEEEIYTPDFVMVSNGKEKKMKRKKQKNKNFNSLGKYILVGGISVAVALGVSIPSTYFLVKNQIESGNLKTSSSDPYNFYTPPSFTSNSDALSVTDAVKKVAPAVVSVSTKSIVNNGFFSQQQEGVGSGFIINKDGDILTNFHVVQGATEVKVTFNNGKEYKAKVVNYDESRDLALIRLQDKVDMPGVATLGDSSKLQAGEDVIAIGNPLGKEFVGTVTKGIVSATNRTLQNQDGSTSVYIQTDAAINPGNSGGPLINSRGEVVGINSAKISENGVEGIGFSIPINDAKDKLGALSTPSNKNNSNNNNNGSVASSGLMLGVVIQDLDKNTAKQQGLPEGILVKAIQNGSPAETAGIEIGDVITGFNGKTVKTSAQLNAEKAKLKEGDKANVVVVRNGKELTLQIVMKAQSNE